jgi:DNA-directed RNA polymerase subunit K/omega
MIADRNMNPIELTTDLQGQQPEDTMPDVEDTLEALLDTEKEAEIAEQARQTQDTLSSLYKHHPECILDYIETVAAKLPVRTVVVNDAAPVDVHHKTQPFLTLFEKTKILGFRTNQLAQGARPFVDVPAYVTSTLEIAKMELEQRRLPFIVKRPLPDGSFEYWRLSDLAVF